MDAKSSLAKYNSTEASRLGKYAKAAGMTLPGKYASGGAVKSKGAKTNITIVVGKDQPKDNGGGLAALAALAPKPAPVVMPPPQGGAPMPPMGAPGAGAPMPGGMKRGGAAKRATALPMTAGSLSAEGRIQKAASESKKEGTGATPVPRKKA